MAKAPNMEIVVMLYFLASLVFSSVEEIFKRPSKDAKRDLKDIYFF